MFPRARRLTHLQCLVIGIATVAVGAVIRTLAIDAGLVSPAYSYVSPIVFVAVLIGGIRCGLVASIAGSALAAIALKTGAIPADNPAAAVQVLLLGLVGSVLAVTSAGAVITFLRRSRAAQERLHAALHATGVGTWRWDMARDVLHWDDRILAAYGLSRDTAPVSISRFLDLVDPRDRTLVRDRLRSAQRTGEDGEMEFRVRAEDGSLRWIYDRHTVIREGDGKGGYIVGASLDATARKRAEEQNAHLAAVIESSGDAILTFALDGRILSWNRGAQDLFGYTADEAIGAQVTMLSTEATRKRSLELMPRVMEGETVRFTGVRLRKDGSEFMAEVTSAPIRNAAGRNIAVSALVRDITQRIAMDQQKELLIRELHHRVRNTLATVQGIVSSSLRFSSYEDVGEAIAERIQALARTHSILTENRDQSADLDRLILLEAAPFVSEAMPRVILEGPAVTLGSAVAVPFSMAIHELVTNSTKYGSLSKPEGRVHIRWSMIDLCDGETGLLVDWRESGGPSVEPPSTEGFGSTLLRRVLGAQLHAKVSWDFAPEGVHVQIRLPMPGSRGAAAHSIKKEPLEPE